MVSPKVDAPSHRVSQSEYGEMRSPKRRLRPGAKKVTMSSCDAPSIPCAALLWAVGLLGCFIVMHRRGLL
jgi:hypothetical protein